MRLMRLRDLDKDQTLTLDQVTAYLKSVGLATFKLPERLEIFEEFPLTATGKIRKHMLVSSLSNESAQ